MREEGGPCQAPLPAHTYPDNIMVQKWLDGRIAGWKIPKGTIPPRSQQVPGGRACPKPCGETGKTVLGQRPLNPCWRPSLQAGAEEGIRKKRNSQCPPSGAQAHLCSPSHCISPPRCYLWRTPASPLLLLLHLVTHPAFQLSVISHQFLQAFYKTK